MFSSVAGEDRNDAAVKTPAVVMKRISLCRAVVIRGAFPIRGEMFHSFQDLLLVVFSVEIEAFGGVVGLWCQSL